MPQDKNDREIKVGDTVVIHATVKGVHSPYVELQADDGTSITTVGPCCEVCDEADDTEDTETE